MRLIHNTAAHLQGTSRTIGAVIIGCSGVRTFCPSPVSKLIECIGGVSALLGLVAMATDVEGLYASVKALSCVLRGNPSARRDMERTRGYQVLKNGMDWNSTWTFLLLLGKYNKYIMWDFLKTTCCWQSDNRYRLFAGWEVYMYLEKNFDQDLKKSIVTFLTIRTDPKSFDNLFYNYLLQSLKSPL